MNKTIFFFETEELKSPLGNRLKRGKEGGMGGGEEGGGGEAGILE